VFFFFFLNRFIRSGAVFGETGEWKKIYQEKSSKYYYWNPATNDVNWCIPGSKWRKFKAPETDRVYYCHAETGTTVWQLPSGVTVPQSGVRPSVASAELEKSSNTLQPRISTTADHPPPTDDLNRTMNGSPIPSSKSLQAPSTSTPLTPTSPKSESKEYVGEETEKRQEFPESPNTDAQALKIKGNNHFNKKEYAEAKECYNSAIALDETCANYFFNRSAVFYCLNDLSNALKDARVAVELAPTNASALTRLGFTLMKMNPPQYDEADKVYESALSIDPKNTRSSKGLAKVRQLNNKT